MRLSKQSIDALQPRTERYIAWDDALAGFGIRVEGSGRKTFICRYRSRGVRRQYTIGRHGVLTAEEARGEARRLLSSVVLGDDPASVRHEERAAIRFSDLVEAFLQGHGPKLKRLTREDYRSALLKHVVPIVGRTPAEAVTARDLNSVHLRLTNSPHRANSVLAYVGSMYSWVAKNGYVPKDCNPARGIKRFKVWGRERYLTTEEMERLGSVLRLAETQGLPWNIKAQGGGLKHVPKTEEAVIYPLQVTGAIRLLLFTGCRLREILHLRWEEVDLDRGLLVLPDSKTGRKVVILNGAAVSVLSSLPRMGPYVIPGTDHGKPRHDLKRPWEHIRSAANLNGLRIHDLRHTYASIGAGAGFGLPIVGRLLGHASPMTTQRYAHLADDPLRRASEAIGDHLMRALGSQAASQTRRQK
jgi:integrase